MDDEAPFPRPEELLSSVTAVMKGLSEADIKQNTVEVRCTVARQIIALMQQHSELVRSWHLEDVGETVTLMGQVESLVSQLVGAKTSFSSYKHGVPLSPNSKKPTPPIYLEYSGREWELTPVNFYLSLAVLVKRMDIIEELIASQDS